jgi:hypothetical protein
MGAIYKISCDNAVSFIKNKVSTEGVEFTVDDQCKEPRKDMPKSVCDMAEAVTRLILSSKIHGNKEEKEKEKEIIDKIVTKIRPYCKRFVAKCSKGLCDEPNNDHLSLTCDDAKKIVNEILNDKNVQTYLQPFNINSDNKCEILEKMTHGDVNKVVSIITHAMAKYIPNIDQEVLKSIVTCICPNFIHKDPVDPIVPVKTDNYNKPAIMFSLMILCIFGLAAFIFYLYFFNAKFSTKIVFAGILICLIITVFLILIYKNSNCRYKFCPVSGDDWVPVEGKFQGKKSMFGRVTVNVKLELYKDNTARIDVLSCEGNSCPMKNLISKCVGGSIVNINIDEKTTNGYSLHGECLNKIKELKASDGKTVIQGAWVVRQGKVISVQLFIHVIVLGTDMSQLFTIPLKRII